MVKVGIFCFILCPIYGCAILLSTSIVSGSWNLQPENKRVQVDGGLGGARVLLASNAALFIKAGVKLIVILIILAGFVVVALCGMCICLWEKRNIHKSEVAPEYVDKGSTELADVRVDSQA